MKVIPKSLLGMLAQAWRPAAGEGAFEAHFCRD
jgi:hypothetical protein